MKNQRIQILDQIRTLETGEILGPDDVATISLLKEQYSETVQNIYQNTPGLFWDIIQVFPEDIWIQIIQHALPSTYYSAALLTLTSVSSTWLQALTSTPVLWAYLEICGSDQDSLATIRTFTHLSHESPLTVTIYLPLRHETRIIHSLLSTVGDRIHQIALANDKHVAPPNPYYPLPPHYYAGIDFLADTLKFTPNVSVIDLGDDCVKHDTIVLKTLTGSLPRRLRAMHCFCFCSTESLEQLLSLTQMRICGALTSLAPHLGMMSQLRSLNLKPRSFTVRAPEIDTTRGPIECAGGFSKLSNLTNLSLHGGFSLSWLDLLTAVAQNLVHINIQMPFPRFPNIFNILSSCIRLRTLSLRLLYWYESDEDYAVPNLPSSSSILSIRSLRSLTLRDSLTPGNVPVEVERKHFERLIMVIASITTLFKDVEEVNFTVYSAETPEHIARILKCLSEIPNLKRLSLTGLKGPFMWNQPQSTRLRRLEELDDPLPIPFTAPRLLSAEWTPGADDLDSMSGYDNVRTLHVNDTDRRPHWIRFPQGSLPHLVNLKLTVSGSYHLRLESFLVLTSIFVTSGPAGATSLCIALLYQQEACPRLTEIEFLQNAPEWDVLFIMLERRNFLTNRGVSRIRRVSLPCIPIGLRTPLAYLLRGLYTSRPKNEDISFDGIIDLVFDKQIAGCFNCLRNMLGACQESVIEFKGDAQELEASSLSVYSTVDNPPPLHLDHAVVEWIHRREVYTLAWKSAVEDKGPQCWRKATCPRYAGSRVEITEHDVD